jgi:hypothetical protein
MLLVHLDRRDRDAQHTEAPGHGGRRAACEGGRHAENPHRRFYVGDAPAPPAPATCTSTPAAGCAAARRSRVVIRGRPRTLVRWSWKGVVPAATDLGDPVSGASAYRFCVYDGGKSLLFGAVAPTGHRCGARPCCTHRKDGGFRYHDRAGESGGVVLLRLAAGKHAGLTFRAEGPGLAPPPLPVAAGSLTAQLRRDDDASHCWESVFARPLSDTPARFRAALP